MELKTNKDLFDSTVRTYLGRLGTSSIELDLGSLLETLEHGEGSAESALNVLVQTHVAYLMLDGCTPFDKDAWTQELMDFRPRLREGLDLCHKVLSNVPRGDEWIKSLSAHIMRVAHGLETSTNVFEPLSQALGFTHDVLDDFSVIESLRRKEYGDSAKNLLESSERRHLTVWHRFFVQNLINRALTDADKLGIEGWFCLVDLCAGLVADSELTSNGYDTYTGNTEISAPVTSAELWAWQFGRVAALGPYIPEDEHGDPLFIPERFEGWGNGLVALSLLLGAPQGADWLRERCWTGALATWPTDLGARQSAEGEWVWAPADEEESREVAELKANSHLYWLMRLGFLAGTAEIEQSVTNKIHPEAKPDIDAQVLVLGSHLQVGESMVDALERAQERHLDRATTTVREHLGPLWDDLPEDVQDRLIEPN